MLKTSMMYALSTMVGLLTFATASFSETIPLVSTTITLNGTVTTVYFNDGDTFRIKDGRHARSRARVVGVNALETYGPIHDWFGSSTYLLDVANEATQMAQNGSWSCTIKNEKDVYGRLLAYCEDLSIALIEAGLAHAYSVDKTPAPAIFLEAQHKAQKDRLGLWMPGIPKNIITSLHSADEGSSRPYNRLISTKDGSTTSWYHHDVYERCEKVCIDDEDSCMIYVAFAERYGRERPRCLYRN